MPGNEGGNSDRILTSLGNYRDFYEQVKASRICIVGGYGNQGRSQALNLRDSGFNVVVGNIDDSYAEIARKDGFRVMGIQDAVKLSDIIFFLIPDEVQASVFESDIRPSLSKGKTIVFASGYNYFYGFVSPPPDVNVIMIAPRMIGWGGVRDVYVRGMGFPALVAVGQDADGRAEGIMLSLCEGLGIFRSGGCAVRSSFREETLVDLLTEHSWAGAMLFLFRAYYDVATSLGASPEAVILELYGSGELAEIAESMRNMGLFKQLRTHSTTSQYGQLTRGPLYVTDDVRKTLYNEAIKILNGEFAREWHQEQVSGGTVLRMSLRLSSEHPMEREEERLYRILGGREGN
ncbi:NAD(P)-binding domain-containing protein [Thermogymnomonas acidicola]|uniref:NAD(P)-binding domain-containing protein n=1 Tax=Thermogymnomonas acidicola TaxID=399579 RepID=UPI000B2DFE55|nr:NAD(P)-binding domain-containing protein [Thermogymnomonas acidicola]